MGTQPWETEGGNALPTGFMTAVTNDIEEAVAVINCWF